MHVSQQLFVLSIIKLDISVTERLLSDVLTLYHRQLLLSGNQDLAVGARKLQGPVAVRN
jgi:hypothetical protein